MTWWNPWARIRELEAHVRRHDGGLAAAWRDNAELTTELQRWEERGAGDCEHILSLRTENADLRASNARQADALKAYHAAGARRSDAVSRGNRTRAAKRAALVGSGR